MVIASTPSASSTLTTTWAVGAEWTTTHMVVLALATLYLLKSLSQLYSRARSAWTLLTRVLTTLSVVTGYVWLLPIPQVGGVYQPKLMLFAAAALHAALPASADKVALIYEHHQHTGNIAPSNGALLSAIGMAASAWTLQKLLPRAREPTSGPTLQPTCTTATPKEANPTQGSRGGKRSTARNQGSSSKATSHRIRDLNRAKWAPTPRPLSVMAAASYASALATLAGLHHAFLRMTPTAKSTTEQGVETSVLFAVTGALATTMLTVVAGTTFRIHPTRVDRGPSARVTRRRLAVLVLILLTVCAPCTTSATVDSATPRYDVSSMKSNHATEMFSSHSWQWFMASRQSIGRKDTRKIPARNGAQSETPSEDTCPLNYTPPSVTVAAAAITWGPYLALTPDTPKPGNLHTTSHSLRWAKGRNALEGIHRIIAELIPSQPRQTDGSTGKPDTWSHL